MKNTALEHALTCLSHPLSIAAAIVLMLNALVLQPLFPSWWTGKIGDFAWLFFVPLVLAAVLSLAAHPLRSDDPKWVISLAIGITGASFAVVKTIPAINAFVAYRFTLLTGYPAKLALDPGDLIALPSLLATWWLWNRHLAARPQRLGQWPALAIAVVALLADSPAPGSHGIVCLETASNGNQIVAFEERTSGYSKSRVPWHSEDGGLSWRGFEKDAPSEAESCNQPRQEAAFLKDASNPPGLQYILIRGQGAYTSDDGGKNFRLENDQLREFNDWIIDASTRNLLVAVPSHEGLIWLRTTKGEWKSIRIPVAPP